MAKKLWERVQEDIEKNRQASEQIRVNANNQFNENIKQNGEFDTNKHTYQMNDLLQSYKNTSKELYNDFKRANGITLWDTVKQTANDLGRVTENTWLGGISGTKQSFNYTYKSGRNHLQSEERQRMENVINSSNLNKAEKDFYINMQKNNNNSKEAKEQNKFLEMELRKSNNLQETNSLPIKQDIYIPISKRSNIILPKSEAVETEDIDIEKIKKVAETSGFDESIEKDNIKIAENIEKQSNGITKKLAELASSIGNMAVGGAVSALNPGAGTAYFALSSAGSYYDDAKQRGMTNREAENYAGIMGLMEGTTEEISFGNFSKAGKTVKTLIKGSGKEVAKEGIEQIGKASIKTALKDYGIGIADNVMQEALIEPIQETVAGAVGGQDKANWENMGQRMLQSGIDGGLVAAITGGAEIGIQSCVGIVEKSKRGETITQNELKNAVKDASSEIDAEKMIIDSVQQQVNKYKDYNTNKPLDSVSQQWLNRANNIINENSNSNLQQNTLVNDIQNVYNNTSLEKVENVPIEDVLQFKTDGGYRDKQYMAELREDIRKNEIDNPIELVRNSDGSIKIENGNHRLQVANELGLKEVPVKFVESWDSVIGNIDKTENKVVKRLEVYNDRNNGNRGKTNIFDGGSRTNEEYSTNNWNQLKNRGTTTRNDRLYSQVQTFTDRPSSTATFEQNSKKTQELGDTSSFNLRNNNSNLQQNITDNSINPLTQQANSQENKVAQNGNVEQINNTKTLYHQTKASSLEEMNTSMRKAGLSDTTMPSGIFLKESDIDIGLEGKNQLKLEATMKNTLEVNDRNELTRILSQDEQYKQLRNEANNFEKIYSQKAEEMSMQATNPKEIAKVENYINDSRNKLNEYAEKIQNEAKDYLQKQGYDSVVINEDNGSFGRKEKSYIVFDKSQLNELANNQQTVYNNTESEGGINGQNQFTNKQEISKQYEQSNRQNRIIQQNDKRRVQELFEKYQRGETDGASNSKELLRNQETRGITEQEQTNTRSQLNEVEANTGSLGYKPDIEGKQRKHYKSVMESDQVGEVGKQSAKSLLENDVYKPLSNIDTLATANENINRNGVDNTYIAFRSKLNSNERITLQDIATGERLIQIFSQSGDIEKVNGLIQDVAMLGTELGQQVQAMSLIKRMSPEGQLMYLNKMVDRLNLKENANLKVSEDMSKRILETKNETELENVMTDIAIELGEQLPVTTSDKLRAWRYLSMLGNPKTHIKNLGANVAMNVTQQLKNKVAGAMEDVVGMFNKGMERTKTLKFANKDQKSFAKKDAEFMKDKIDGGGKYDIKNVIQSNKRQFDNKTLNAIADFNSNMLELEDNIFLKKAYQQAMQNYMSANKLSSSDMENSSVLQKAREYASYQAQEATFHQFSELAKRLTEIENKGGIAGKALEAVIPFKKTPINIAKSGVEYSPIGLVKSITYDIVQLNKKTKDYKAKLEKGVITEADYKTGTSKLVTKTIDNVAKGFTGTSLALIGYALKDMGILKSGNDDEDDEFREKLGEQEYAIRIGNNTYTLDWVSPSAIPMFMGATVHDLVHSQDEDNSNALNSLMTSSAKALEPMTEMSMLQGLTGAISSYEQGSSNMMFDLGSSAVSSYLGQFVPTALGQVAKTIDDKERDTSSTEKGVAKKVDQFAKQQLAKIPIASKLLPVRKDVWGNEKTRDSNPLVRAYEVGLAPYNRKKVVEDYTEKELLKVFEDTGEKSVLPGIPNKDITINKQKYRLTSEEYNKAKETFGKTSKSMLDSLVKTNEYKQLSHEQKASAIDNIYSYAKEKIKVDYAKGKKQEVETSSPYNILNELKNPTNQSEYLSYSAKIQGIEKDTEKKEILANGKYSEITKETIYKNTLGKEDDLYNNILAKDNININEYLNYKLQKFESDKEDDGTVKGKSIKGSRPKKLYDYVNNMNITKNQKLAIIGTQYKLNRSEQQELYDYINKIPGQTQKEKLNIFSKYSSNFIINKDNTINIK